MGDFLGAIVVILVAVIVICVVGLLLAFPTMLLWNGALVPAVTFAKPITWLQAWGLMILSGLMIKSTTSNNSKSN